MDERRTTWRRMATLAVAAGALAGTTIVASASTASARPSPDYSHSCGLPLGNPDNGVVTDVVHHSVEPLVAPLGARDAVHGLNCGVLLTVDSLLFGYQPFPGSP